MVEDTGIGMPEEVQARIFEPFFTTKPRERGTGLGLAIVHRIVIDHHGQIEVGSREGHGTRITISFPCCDAPETEPAPSPDGFSAHAGHGEMVIVVEDNPQVLEIVSSSLQSAGYQVAQASDGVEAMTVFGKHWDRARMVVLDLYLPKKSGRACLREMRERRLGLPVVIITGSVEPDIEENLSRSTRLLRKPFRIGELETVIAEALSAPPHSR